MSEEEQAEFVAKRGGARKGAGRKTKYEKTIVMRVPEIYREHVQALIAHLDDTRHINKHYPQGRESECVFLRSLDGHAQDVTFKTKPRI